jgi:hypothetical protein
MVDDKYSVAAARLQSSVRFTESQQNTDYTKEMVDRAIVHGREDIVLLCSHLSALNAQTATIRRLLWFIALVSAYLLFRLLR